ncbi:response regulator [Parapedobacter soli]|uniref:response regulator n=1 Tax=Parapedobacter soli TaxID=416955 RepID=UPI0021C69844|nr:response regulator [Parapedobacter soli]
MELDVLVIDDDEIFNLMANIMLRDLGITTQPKCFTSGQEALAFIRQSKKGISYLLFLDINMPTMSGWEVLDHLGAMPNHLDIHVVIVTSSIDRADKEKALDFKQVINFMTKPINREELSALKEHEKIAVFFPR